MSKNNMLNLGANLALGGDTTFSGAYTFTGTLTDNTAVTFPTSGTLVTAATAITNPVLLNGDPVLGFVDVGATASNYTSLANSASGDAVTITADGSDADITLNVSSKGNAGVLVLCKAGAVLHGNQSATISDSSYDSITLSGGNLAAVANLELSLAGTSLKFSPGSANYYMPTANGSSGEALLDDGSGNLYWGSPISNPITISGDPVLGFTDAGASAVNYWNIGNSNTGTPLVMTAAGSDTDVLMKIKIKGSGYLRLTTDSEDAYIEMGGDGAILLQSASAKSVTLRSGSVGVSIYSDNAAYLLPTTQGSARQTLIDDGFGVLYWGGPGVLQNQDGSPVVMPATQGGAGSALLNDGSGNLYWFP